MSQPVDAILATMPRSGLRVDITEGQSARLRGALGRDALPAECAAAETLDALVGEAFTERDRAELDDGWPRVSVLVRGGRRYRVSVLPARAGRQVSLMRLPDTNFVTVF